MSLKPSEPDIIAALQWARQYIDMVDARILLRHTLQCAASYLIAHRDTPLSAPDWESFTALVNRRHQGEPVAYLIGKREFFGYELQVNPHVLIPRPETELLIELALAFFSTQTCCHILDLGTGSGAIAIALSKELPYAEVTAVDRSPDALMVASANAILHQSSISFVVSNWFDALHGDTFHLIVANPPYIAHNDPHLKQGDLRYEPNIALASGVSGLDDLSTITQGAPAHLMSRGWLLLEHGHEQASAVRGLLTDAGFSNIQSWHDLAGIERVSGGQWLGRR